MTTCRSATTPDLAPRCGIRAFAVVTLLGGILLLGSGCGGGPAYPATDLEGAVSVSGKPIEKGAITFTPKDMSKGQPVGSPIIDGKYSAKAVPLGQVVVTFNAMRDTGKTIPASGSTPVPLLENMVPKKYRQGTEINVVQGQKEQNFDLQSK